MEWRRVRVLVVDDHQVVLLGLKALLRCVPDFEVVGEASTADDAEAIARETRPEVVLMDVRLPGRSGIDACRVIVSERPETRVIMLSSYDDSEFIVTAIKAGARGYLSKALDPDNLVTAVRRAAQGESLLDTSSTAAIVEWMRRADQSSDDPLAALTEQERRIVPLVAEGKTNRQISVELHLSESTIKAYASKILRKLQLARRAELAALMARSQSWPKVAPERAARALRLID